MYAEFVSNRMNESKENKRIHTKRQKIRNIDKRAGKNLVSIVNLSDASAFEWRGETRKRGLEMQV